MSSEPRPLREDAEHNRGPRESLRDGRRAQTVERLHPPVERLLARARADGAVRPDLTVEDLPLLALALVSVAERTRYAGGRFWRRYQTLTIDGLRAGRDAPARTGPITVRELDVAVDQRAVP